MLLDQTLSPQPVAELINLLDEELQSLSHAERSRLQDLTVFKRDAKIPCALITALWQRTANMKKADAEALFKTFRRRKLMDFCHGFLPLDAEPGQWVQLNPLVHDYFARMMQPPPALHRAIFEIYREQYPGGWHAAPDDGYFHLHIFTHLMEGTGGWAALGEALCDLRFVEALCRFGDHKSIETAYIFCKLDLEHRLQKSDQVYSDDVAGQKSRMKEQLQQLLGYSCFASQNIPQIPRCFYNVPGVAVQHALQRSPFREVRENAMSLAGQWFAPILQHEWQKEHQTAVGAGEKENAHSVSEIALLENNLVVTGAPDGLFVFWDAGTGECLHAIPGVECQVTCIAPFAGNCIVAAGSNLTAWQCDRESVTCIAEFHGHLSAVNAVAVAPDGLRLASGGEDKAIRIWDFQTRECVAVLKQERAVETLMFTPDGRFLVSGDGSETVSLWDVASGAQLRCFRGKSLVKTFAVTPDADRMVVGYEDGTFRVWNLATGQCLRSLGRLEGRSVSALAVASDGRHAWCSYVDASGSLLCLWDLESGRCRNVYWQSKIVRSLAIDSAQQKLYFAKGNQLACLRLQGLEFGASLRADNGSERYEQVLLKGLLYSTNEEKTKRANLDAYLAALRYHFASTGRRPETCKIREHREAVIDLLSNVFDRPLEVFDRKSFPLLGPPESPVAIWAECGRDKAFCVTEKGYFWYWPDASRGAVRVSQCPICPGNTVLGLFHRPFNGFLAVIHDPKRRRIVLLRWSGFAMGDRYLPVFQERTEYTVESIPLHVSLKADTLLVVLEDQTVVIRFKDFDDTFELARYVHPPFARPVGSRYYLLESQGAPLEVGVLAWNEQDYQLQMKRYPLRHLNESGRGKPVLVFDGQDLWANSYERWGKAEDSGPWIVDDEGFVYDLVRSVDRGISPVYPAIVQQAQAGMGKLLLKTTAGDFLLELTWVNASYNSCRRLYSQTPEQLLSLEIKPSWRKVRTDFTHIGVWDESHLALLSDDGIWFRIGEAHGNIQFDNATSVAIPEIPLSSIIPFGPPKTDLKHIAVLRAARWPDGSRAYLDDRGILHLQSKRTEIPEVSMVIPDVDGPFSAWSSDEVLSGEEYFIGKQKPSPGAGRIIASHIRQFVSEILAGER